MNRVFQYLMQSAGFCAVLVATAPALAQITNVTDGTTSTTACTSYAFSAAGVLTFSPPNCLLASPPPPPPPGTPVYSFTTGSSQVVETTATSTVTVRRSGSDLSAAGSVIVNYVPGSAAPGTDFGLAVPPFVSPALQIPVTFGGAASGVSTQEYSFDVYIVNRSTPSNLPPKTLSFSLLSPTGGVLGATASHTVSILGAAPQVVGDVTIGGVAIGDPPLVGFYAARQQACEDFTTPGATGGNPGTPYPGQGGRWPCGSYEIPVTSTRNQCSSGMTGSNAIANAYMFLNEPAKNGATYFGGNSMSFALRKDAAFVIKFKTGGAGEYTPNSQLPPGAVGQINFGFGEFGPAGPSATRHVTISPTPCDFDYGPYDQNDFCRANINPFGGSLLAQVTTGTADMNKCKLLPNTTYYLNMRYEDVGVRNGSVQTRGVISCQPTPGAPSGAYCSTLVRPSSF